MCKKILLLILTSSVLHLTSYSQDNSPVEKKLRKLPAIELKTMDGKNSNSNTFSNDGKPIVICFWATWCKPCINELSAISENYSDWKKETGVKVIAISIDDSKTMSRVSTVVNGKSWDYEVYIDLNSDFKRAMNVNMPPHSFLLNGKNEIVWQHASFTPGDEEKLFENIKKVAEGKDIQE